MFVEEKVTEVAKNVREGTTNFCETKSVTEVSCLAFAISSPLRSSHPVFEYGLILYCLIWFHLAFYGRKALF